MKLIKAFLAVSYLILSPAYADITEYDIEIIIFEDTSGRYANSEQWQHEITELTTESTVAGSASAKQINTNGIDSSKNIIRIDGIGLNKYARKLKSNKRYNVLVHKSWRQSGLADDAAIDIPIDSRQTNKANINSIDGSLRIVLGRYLHIYTDMIYKQPYDSTDNESYGQALHSPQHKEFPIKFHRRMRSKELHYLDHPVVGILVMAKPVKKQEELKQES